MIEHVLVTGGLGHIGSALIRHLAEISSIERITILDNLVTQRYASLFNLPLLSPRLSCTSYSENV